MKKKISNLIYLYAAITENIRIGFECVTCNALPRNKKLKDYHDWDSILDLEERNGFWSVEAIDKLIEWLEKHKGHNVIGIIPDGEDLDKLKDDGYLITILKKAAKEFEGD